MKVLVYGRTPDAPLSGNERVDLMPDSAIIKDGKPFFVPPFSERWNYRVGIVARICRLGKNIGRKFAPRYVDAVGICLLTEPVDAMERAAAHNALLQAYEGAVILGDISRSEFGVAKVGDIELTLGDEIERIYDIVADASRYCTMKIGDLIVSSSIAGGTLEIGQELTGTIDDTPALTVRVR